MLVTSTKTSCKIQECRHADSEEMNVFTLSGGNVSELINELISSEQFNCSSLFLNEIV